MSKFGSKFVENEQFMKKVNKLREEDWTESQVASEFGMTTVEFRRKMSRVAREDREFRIDAATILKENGYSNADISALFGMDESYVRSLFVEDDNKVHGWDRLIEPTSPFSNMSLNEIDQHLIPIEARLNELLIARGHVFLNEVYDALNIPRTLYGAHHGWTLDGPKSTPIKLYPRIVCGKMAIRFNLYENAFTERFSDLPNKPDNQEN